MLDGDLNSSYGREADLMANDRSWPIVARQLSASRERKRTFGPKEAIAERDTKVRHVALTAPEVAGVSGLAA
jgi:hypothetical protein